MAAALSLTSSKMLRQFQLLRRGRRCVNGLRLEPSLERAQIILADEFLHLISLRFGGLSALIAIHLYFGNPSALRKASGALWALVTGRDRTLDACTKFFVHPDQLLVAVIAVALATGLRLADERAIVGRRQPLTTIGHGRVPWKEGESGERLEG
jgi:hypothetical protein